jgi:hypothetical protein
MLERQLHVGKHHIVRGAEWSLPRNRQVKQDQRSLLLTSRIQDDFMRFQERDLGLRQVDGPSMLVIKAPLCDAIGGHGNDKSRCC